MASLSACVRGLRRLPALGIEVLLPELCVFCGGGDTRAGVCDPCRRLLPWLTYACPRCAQALPGESLAAACCARCQLDAPAFARTASALRYQYPVDAALKALKFSRRLYYAPAFAALLEPLLAQHFATADALIPVPLHRWRHARRGFNQAAEICKPLARRCGLPMLRSVTRIRATPPQSGLSAAERRRNLRGAFALEGGPACRSPVIVDDVMTTGETCRQLACLLLDAGAESVRVLTVARA